MNVPEKTSQERLAGPRRIVSSGELFTGGREILIRNKNDTYRLMITKAGKLILNK